MDGSSLGAKIELSFARDQNQVNHPGFIQYRMATEPNYQLGLPHVSEEKVRGLDCVHALDELKATADKAGAMVKFDPFAGFVDPRRSPLFLRSVG